MAPLSSAPSSRPDPSASASARPADPAEVPATTILRATASTPELQSIHSQLRVLEQTSVALRRTESKLLKDTESCRGEVVAQIKRVKTLQSLMLEQGASKQELEEIDELSKRLDNLDSRFPRPSRAMLRLSLGSANVAMAFKDRFRYKAEYETFKFRFTIIQLVMATLAYIFIDQTWLNAIFNFLVLYYYCTLSLRDHILLVNGSRIHSWWLIHHYLSALLSGILLVWPDLPNFPVTRQQINLFYIIVGAIQLLQFRYQMGRLRTLRTLGKRRPLDVVSGDAAIVVDGPGSRTASSILSPVSPLTPSVSAASTAAMAAAVAAASAGSSASATATAAATAAAASLAAAGDSGALTSTESTPGVICPPLAGAGVGGSTSSVAVAGGATGRARSGSREGGLLGSTIGRLNMILPFLIAGQMCQLFNGFSCLVIAFSRGRSDIDLYALAAAVLFLITGSGNMYTTLRIYHGKLVRSRNLREAVRRATEKERQRQNLLKHQPACGTAAAPGPAAPPVVVPDAAPAPAEPHPEPVSQPPPEPAPAVSRPRVVFSNDDPDVEPGAEPPGTGDLEHSVDEETDTVVISSSARIPSEQADIRMVNAS